MIGTQIRVGFDGSQVQKGLGSISKMFGKMGSAIGRGAFERVGQRATDMLSRFIDAVPDMMKSTADFAGELNDLSTASGASIESLMTLGEVLRIGGAESVDTTRMIANLSKSVYEAMEVGGGAADAFLALGMSADDLKGKSLDTIFNTIGKSVQASNKPMGELTDLLGEIFGAKIGYKQIAVFRQLGDNTERAKKNLSGIAQHAQRSSAFADEMGDAFGRIKNSVFSIGLTFFDQIRRFGGAGIIDKIFDNLNPEKLAPFIEGLISSIGRNIEAFMSTDLTSLAVGFINNLADKIKSFRESIFGTGWDIGTKVGGGIVDAVNSGIIGALANLAMEFMKTFLVVVRELGMAFGGAAFTVFENGIKKWIPDAPSMNDIIGGLKGAVGLRHPKTTSASDAYSKQMQDQTKILKDIYKQGNVAVLA